MRPRLEGKSNRDRGNTGFGVAVSYFTSKGNTVLLPLNDTQPYDLAIDVGGFLNRVQVKTTSYKKPSGNYTVALRTSGGNRSRSTVRHFDRGDYELLFVYCDDSSMYLIPTSEIGVKNSLTLNENTEKYRIEFM